MYAVEPAHGAQGLAGIHLAMVDAVLGGAGVEAVAALAAAEHGGAVAIVLPAAGVAALAPLAGRARADELTRYAAERLSGRPAKLPAGVVAEAAVDAPAERLGYVLLLDAETVPGTNELLRLVALVTLTAVTLQRWAPATRRQAHAELLEEIRHGGTAPHALLERAQRLGCDLGRGAAAVCVRPAPADGERVLALIAQDFPDALAAPRGDRVEALLPAGSGDARRLARRLSCRAPAGLAPAERDPARLRRALAAAELSMALGEREALAPDELLSPSWQLLVRAAVDDAGQLDALVDSTVGAASGTQLETLRAYFAHGANMNATAAAIYAHRHTVAYRLDQLAELTGHDPRTTPGQAELALGLQALAVRAARASSVE